MLRSMYSGVSGMKAHQAKMDVIGNNIANVNTYGFKSSRATFTEVYYQTTKSASAATSNRGGVNASQIGYGVNVGGVDVMHTRSGFQMTDNGMDVAIAGDGFFQVQDADGNIFYTRSGLFRIDPNGNLVDTNGNFVLGVSGDPFGKEASFDRIQFSVPSSTPAAPSVTESINGLQFKVQASNATKDGNVSFTFMSDPTMAIGQKVKATIGSNGVQISLNAFEQFASMDELSTLINQAVTEANGAKEHPGGRFTFTVDSATAFATPLTGAEIASTKYTPSLGNVGLGKSMDELGFKFGSVGNTFLGDGSTEFQVTRQANSFKIDATVNGVTYSATIPESAKDAGKVKLVPTGSAEASDYIIFEHPGFSALTSKADGADPLAPKVVVGSSFFDYTDPATLLDATGASTKSTASKALGLSSKSIALGGGTTGGAQTVSDLTNIGIGADGVISAIHPQLGLISIGRIDLATFENPQGLTQEGNTYFAESPNSGKAGRVNAGTSGSGALRSGALEMSNVDLSKEFADMITTQRGFQASSRLITVSDEILNELVNLKR